MKKQRLWARTWHMTLVAWLLFFSSQVSAAKPADATLNLPSSKSSEKFHLWLTMHADSYLGTIDSALSQCYNTVFVADYLNSSKCQLFGEMLESGQCMEDLVKDGTRLTHMNGRVNGDPKGESKAWTNQEKATGRLDRALLCELGDGVSAYWFTGVPGQSCNNVGFVYNEPEVVEFVPPPPPPTVVTQPQRYMQHTGVVRSDSVQYVSGVTVPGCCGQCDLNIPSVMTVIQDGDGLQSSGSTPVDW